jgi:hypothetical protein
MPPNPHPLALAYLRAFAAAHHARGHVVPTGMPTPAMQMHRARDAWQRAGCPLEVEAAHATPAEARAMLAALLADTPIEHEPSTPPTPASTPRPTSKRCAGRSHDSDRPSPSWSRQHRCV